MNNYIKNNYKLILHLYKLLMMMHNNDAGDIENEIFVLSKLPQKVYISMK